MIVTDYDFDAEELWDTEQMLRRIFEEADDDSQDG